MDQRPVDQRAGAHDVSDERSLQARYRRVCHEVVPKFLERHRLTRAGLADLLGVEKSALSRFLNGVQGYTPSRSRPGKVEILERIEARCSRLNIFSELEDKAQQAALTRPEDDDRVWFDNFLERLFILEEKYEAATALLMLPELCSQAMHAGPPYGASMATNVLLIPIVGHVDRPEMADASPELLRHTAERVRRLERFALENASDAFRETVLHKPIGYAGYALAMIGLLLTDDELVDEGLEALLKAALLPHETEDGHWPNLLMVLSRLFELEHPKAKTWSERVARLAQDHWSAQLQYAHVSRAFPEVRAHWGLIVPDLMHRIDVEADAAPVHRDQRAQDGEGGLA